jgi:DNA-binding IclR family transcriptional regulator
MSSKERKYYFVKSLAKGLRIIDLLASQGDISVSQVAASLEISRASSHRFLLTLRDLGYVEKNKVGRFRLSFKVLELGMKKLEGFEIRHTVKPFMQEIALAFGETVNFGHWDRNAIVHLDKINSKEILRIDAGIGAIAPAYCTGLGKAILAFLPEDDLNNYLQSTKLVAVSVKTITDRANLRADLEKIQKCGYAVDDEELSLGLRCVAAPIFDYTGKPNYALSISGPSQRITNEKIDAIQAKLVPLCRRISRKIGATKQSDHNRG